jgi:phosphatidylinositol alpha-mannosyltransferase
MKIGLISPYNIFKGGGVQECVLALQAELIRRGHEAKIITPAPRSYEGEQPENVIFMGASTDMKSPLHTTVQISATGNGDRVSAVLNEEKFDILNFHEPWIPIISRQILAKSTAINVGTFHAKLPDTRVSKTIEKVITPYTKGILKSFDALTAVSDAGAEYVKKLTDMPINLIPNGIDLAKYKPKPSIKTDEPTIFYIGRLEKRKGVKYLLKAFAVLQETMPEAKLIIGGDGPDREKLEELAYDLELKNIEFLGFVSDEDKIRLMQSSTVFCAPALYGESFGIVLLEAMACGTPVVAGDNPGYAGVMQGRGELSLVDPRHTDDFARRLHMLLSDEGLRKSWNTWAHEYVQQFDYSHIVDQYEALYENLCQKKAQQNG